MRFMTESTTTTTTPNSSSSSTNSNERQQRRRRRMKLQIRNEITTTTADNNNNNNNNNASLLLSKNSFVRLTPTMVQTLYNDAIHDWEENYYNTSTNTNTDVWTIATNNNISFDKQNLVGLVLPEFLPLEITFHHTNTNNPKTTTTTTTTTKLYCSYNGGLLIPSVSDDTTMNTTTINDNDNDNNNIIEVPDTLLIDNNILLQQQQQNTIQNTNEDVVTTSTIVSVCVIPIIYKTNYIELKPLSIEDYDLMDIYSKWFENNGLLSQISIVYKYQHLSLLVGNSNNNNNNNNTNDIIHFIVTKISQHDDNDNDNDDKINNNNNNNKKEDVYNTTTTTTTTTANNPFYDWPDDDDDDDTESDTDNYSIPSKLKQEENENMGTSSSYYRDSSSSRTTTTTTNSNSNNNNNNNNNKTSTNTIRPVLLMEDTEVVVIPKLRSHKSSTSTNNNNNNNNENRIITSSLRLIPSKEEIIYNPILYELYNHLQQQQQQQLLLLKYQEQLKEEIHNTTTTRKFDCINNNNNNVPYGCILLHPIHIEKGSSSTTTTDTNDDDDNNNNDNNDQWGYIIAKEDKNNNNNENIIILNSETKKRGRFLVRILVSFTIPPNHAVLHPLLRLDIGLQLYWNTIRIQLLDSSSQKQQQQQQQQLHYYSMNQLQLEKVTISTKTSNSNNNDSNKSSLPLPSWFYPKNTLMTASTTTITNNNNNNVNNNKSNKMKIIQSMNDDRKEQDVNSSCSIKLQVGSLIAISKNNNKSNSNGTTTTTTTIEDSLIKLQIGDKDDVDDDDDDYISYFKGEDNIKNLELFRLIPKFITSSRNDNDDDDEDTFVLKEDEDDEEKSITMLSCNDILNLWYEYQKKTYYYESQKEYNNTNNNDDVESLPTDIISLLQLNNNNEYMCPLEHALPQSFLSSSSSTRLELMYDRLQDFDDDPITNIITSSSSTIQSYSIPITIFYGPNGCGKTHTALLLASLTRFIQHRPTLYLDCKRLQESPTAIPMMDILDQFHTIFNQAINCRPSMIILDDLDCLIPNYNSSGDDDDNNDDSARVQGVNPIALSQSKLIVDRLVQLLEAVSVLPSSSSSSSNTKSNVVIVITCANMKSLHPTLFKSVVTSSSNRWISIPTLNAKERITMLKNLLLLQHNNKQRHYLINKNNNNDDDDDEWNLLESSGLLGKWTEGFRPRDIQKLALRIRQLLLVRHYHHPTTKEKQQRYNNDHNNNNNNNNNNILQGVISLALKDYIPLSHMSLSQSLSSSKTIGLVSNWTDLGGIFNVKEKLTSTIVHPAKYRRIYEMASNTIRLPRGILLYGPPGCGKSVIVPALAKECNYPLITCKGPELLDKYIGASEAKVRELFTRASAIAPSILFLDELDALAPRRGSDHTGVTDRVVNQLLTFLDGVEDTTRNRQGDTSSSSSAGGGGTVYIIAATSRPDKVDPALLRPGRLEQHLYVGLPESDDEWIDLFMKIVTHWNFTDSDRQYLMSSSSTTTTTTTTTTTINNLSSNSDTHNLDDHNNKRNFVQDILYSMPYVRDFSPADFKAVMDTAHVDAVHKALSEAMSPDEVKEVTIPLSILKEAFAKTRPCLCNDDAQLLEEVYRPFRGRDLKSKLTKTKDFNGSTTFDDTVTNDTTSKRKLLTTLR